MINIVPTHQDTKKMEEFLLLQQEVNASAACGKIEKKIQKELLKLINEEFKNPTISNLTREIYLLMKSNQTTIS